VITVPVSDIEFSIEVITVPVGNVERALRFHADQVGFMIEVDYWPNDLFRAVQITPPGSNCSLQIGKGLTDALPGSLRKVTRDSLGGLDLVHENGADAAKPGWSAARNGSAGSVHGFASSTEYRRPAAFSQLFSLGARLARTLSDQREDRTEWGGWNLATRSYSGGR
jgi:hypothetical protein